MRTRRQYQRRCLTWLWLVVAQHASAAVPTGASTYWVDWYSINDGGHSTAVGAVYRLRGSIGQPVVGAAASANYTLDAGFWFGATGNQCSDCIFANGFEQTGEP
jgi:hypothetical protein